jgi:hypothetical protein
MDKSWDVSIIELTFGPTYSGEVYYGPNNQITPALSYSGDRYTQGYITTSPKPFLGQIGLGQYYNWCRD